MAKKIKTPAGEIIKTQYFSESGERMFVLTTKPFSQYFFLYRIEGDRLKKLGRGTNPLELEEQYHINKELRKEGSNDR